MEWYSLDFYIIMVVGLGLIIYCTRLYLNRLVKRKLGYIPKNFGRNLTIILYIGLTALLIFGRWYEDFLKDREFSEYKIKSENIGRIYSNDLMEMNHHFISEHTIENDRIFARIYREMLDWQKGSPEVENYYTMKKNKDGKIYFAVGLETDYNKDGKISGKKEKSIPIGTLYDESIPELEEAFKGKFTIQREPTVDAWSQSITAFYPIKDFEGKTDAVLGIDYNGQDFLLDMDANQWKAIGLIFPVILFCVLLYVLGMYSKIEEQVDTLHKKEINTLAYYDDLTELPNRYYLLKMLDSYEKNHPSFAVVLFELVGLNSINSLFGYSVGDKFMKKALHMIESGLITEHVLGRWGGCDFVIVIPGFQSQSHLLSLAEGVFRSLKHPISIDGREFLLSTKIGISVYPVDGTDGKTLIQNADIARSHSKNKPIQFYNQQVVDEIRDKLSLEIELRKALKNREFVLYYQPQLSVATEELIGIEALIRWIHPEKGFIPPNEFIPLAEELNLIESIGRWVLMEACSETRRLIQKSNIPLQVSVNLSPIQFDNDQIAEEIESILKETGLSPCALDLEITESALFNYQRSSQIINRIKGLGVQISLDDFGSGYSSLSHLQNLSIDRLKIDRSFLMDIPEQDDTILSSIIMLGHQLGLTVLAEGAETREQLDFLKMRKCDQVQGYYLSRPLPVDELENFIERSLQISNQTIH
ncbi:putative bifunctional diguanylate cyclase/phosphodiesterase [Peribacillus sp. SCS-26]|uniref:putative bifunctional diguanylate cyclase/phosphodiesterase n=1 Tax=Paraperibacillus marinus TaxID=3115295 RepID=UPI003905F4BE